MSKETSVVFTMRPTRRSQDYHRLDVAMDLWFRQISVTRIIVTRKQICAEPSFKVEINGWTVNVPSWYQGWNEGKP